MGGRDRPCRNSSGTTAAATREPRRASACRASAARCDLAAQGSKRPRAAFNAKPPSAAPAAIHWGGRLNGRRVERAILLNGSSTVRIILHEHGYTSLTASESAADNQTSSTFLIDDFRQPRSVSAARE
jgi:hypothetical protein